MPKYVPINIVVPEGTSFQENNDLLCFPATWTTALQFFVLNFFLHAFTTLSRPGEQISDKIFTAVLAFFFPVSGVRRGIDAIYRHASFQREGNFFRNISGVGTNRYRIRQATQAGAFAVMIRESLDQEDPTTGGYHLRARSWRRSGVTLRGTLIPAASTTTATTEVYRIKVSGHDKPKAKPIYGSRDINGLVMQRDRYKYRLMVLPNKYQDLVQLSGPIDKKSEEREMTYVPQSSSVVTTLVAILQILNLAYNLSRVTGDQFAVFGYSAFHLVAIPYVLMSFVNLVGNLATPTFSSLTLIDTFVSKEAHLRAETNHTQIGYLDDGQFDVDDGQFDAKTAQQYRIVAWDCKSNMAVKEHHNSGPLDPKRYGSRQKICFVKDCEGPHKGELVIPSGIPKPDEDAYSSRVKALLYFIVVSLHVAPVVVIGLMYGSPKRLDHKMALPLWLATGDGLGCYILFVRTDATILLNMRLWFQNRILFGIGMDAGEINAAKGLSATPRAVLLFFIVGIAIGVWNFYIVVTQILTFGRCVNISRSL